MIPTDMAATKWRSGTFSITLLHHQGKRIIGSDHDSADRSGTGTAVRLNHIAIQFQGTFAKRIEIERRADRTTDQTLDFLCPSGLATANCLTFHPGMRRTRQHAVFRRQPSAPPAPQKRWHRFLNTGGTDHFGIAEHRQDRTFGIFGIVADKCDRPHGIERTTIGTDDFRIRHFLVS